MQLNNMETKRNRRDRRQQKRSAEVQKAVQPVRYLPVYELLDEQDLVAIDNAAMTILEEIGIDFYDDEVLGLLQAHGATVDGITVRMPRGLVETYVAKAPATFTQIARNPANNVIIGGRHLCFSPVYGPPFVYDQEKGRREATLTDFHNFVKLTYMSPWLHHSAEQLSNRQMSRRTRATSICCMLISNTATSRLWAR